MALMGPDVINAMREAVAEIRMLRQSYALMEARLRGIDDALQLLNATPPTRGGAYAGQDAAWALEREIEKLDKQLAEEAQGDTAGQEATGLPQ